MKDSYQGYVVYGVQGKKYLPIGIISSDYKRQTISSKIPAKMKSGLIAVEDKRFYNHLGLDYRGIARAVRNNIKKSGLLKVEVQLRSNLQEIYYLILTEQ
ncbi:transglycosylase domain-containing protein [uncultured Alistipes sp.]|uniref:transglycosylase domain-containing protein n=1 Tax=uncultured Alistipes sp. TaxID=538949 RepID=UPI002648EB67|nr:transglycosylase domain-containing protein [uncultured Alistipes sp.]